MKKSLALFILIFITSCLATSQVINLNSLQGYSDGSVITLRWNTDNETNVTKFVIDRRVGTSGAFIQIGMLNPKGASLYIYEDKTAFRSTATLYQYQIHIKFADGSPDQELGPISVSHSVNSVKRTWGSIKAMFR